MTSDFAVARLAIGLCFLIAAAAGCGGTVTSPSTGVDGDAGVGVGDGGRTDGGKPQPACCPTTPSARGTKCAVEGLECEYSAEFAECGGYTCTRGEWQRALTNSGGCPAPAGLVCPVPEAPLVGGPTQTIDKSCDAVDDCALVTLTTSCCGDTLAYAVNKKSVTAAQSYAATCARTFPGCGCAARATRAESGTSDAGFAAKIVAQCGPNGCVSVFED